MEHVLKSFLGVFFLLLLVFLITGIITVQVEVGNARNYHADAIAQIENSNFNAGVVNACIEQAEALGYEMEVTLYHEEADSTIAKKGQSAGGTKDVYLASVEMHYHYQLLFLELMSDHVLRGFAK